MDKELQRIAIAQFCGWKLKWQNKGGGELFDVKPDKFSWAIWCPPKNWFQTKEGKQWRESGSDWIETPDYLNDLNAIHGAEKLLSDSQYDEFLENLEFITWSANQTTSQQRRKKTSATAEQRCEAFLRTLNLWEE